MSTYNIFIIFTVFCITPLSTGAQLHFVYLECPISCDERKKKCWKKLDFITWQFCLELCMEEGVKRSWKNGKTIWESGKRNWKTAYRHARTLKTWKKIKSFHKFNWTGAQEVPNEAVHLTILYKLSVLTGL